MESDCNSNRIQVKIFQKSEYLLIQIFPFREMNMHTEIIPVHRHYYRGVCFFWSYNRQSLSHHFEKEKNKKMEL